MVLLAAYGNFQDRLLLGLGIPPDTDEPMLPVPAEQRAYAYARKLSRTPWELTRADYRTLEKDLGPEKALYTF
jgi:hypothetical protein